MALLTKTEAAERHGLQRRDITHMVSEGLLPEHRIPGRRHPLYDPGDVDAAMAATKQIRPAPPAPPKKPAENRKKPQKSRPADILSFEDAVRRT